MKEKKEKIVGAEDWRNVTALIVAQSKVNEAVFEVNRRKTLLGIPIQSDYLIDEVAGKIFYTAHDQT